MKCTLSDKASYVSFRTASTRRWVGETSSVVFGKTDGTFYFLTPAFNSLNAAAFLAYCHPAVSISTVCPPGSRGWGKAEPRWITQRATAQKVPNEPGLLRAGSSASARSGVWITTLCEAMCQGALGTWPASRALLQV